MLNLHIGGKEAHPDWKILDIEPRPEVDYIGDAADLSQFPDSSIDRIYASHVLEHFHYGIDNQLLRVLREWHRALKPGGKLMVGVPDLRTLCWLFLHPNLVPIERHYVMSMMFGGQLNIHDVHKVGFDFDILSLYLGEAGFTDFEQVVNFGLFEDSTTVQLMDMPVSLNIIAVKPQS